MRHHSFDGRSHHGHPRHAAGRGGRGPFGHPGHGRGGPFGPGAPGRPGGRHRMFDQGELRLVMLALIAEAPRHGYEIIRAIEDRLAGTYSPSPGIVYPTLTLLQELGLVTVEENDGRKRYSITREGESHLADHRAAVDAALERMRGISERLGGGPSPQIVRAMENLRLAMRLRLQCGPLTQAQVDAVAAALDAAAGAIERS